MKILVTGGAGFIGSNFVRYLLKADTDCHIVNLDKLTYAGNLENLNGVDGDSRYEFVQGDICDKELIEKLFADKQFDAVVHFAAESHVDRSIDGPAEFIETNIIGTFNLLEAAKEQWGKSGGLGVESKDSTGHSSPATHHRFLHVSTDEVYGSLGATGLFSEETPYDPHSPYSASKASSDHIVSSYFHTYGLPVLITNCSNNYGPYQFPEKLIPLMINNALTGKDLPVYGDGRNIRDWLYVVDHCHAIHRVLQDGRLGETYNIGGNSERQNIEVVHALCDILDDVAAPLESSEPRRSLIRYVTDRPGHDRRYAIDASKVKNALGWEPEVTFEEGLRETILWYLNHAKWVSSVLDGSYKDYYSKMYGGRAVSRAVKSDELRVKS